MNNIESYENIISDIEDYAIILLDAKGFITNWNKGAEKLKGYSAEEIIGKNFEVFYSLEDRANKIPENALRNAIAKGKFTAESWRMRKDGSQFWASVLIHPLKDAQDKLIGFIKITRDLTERKNFEEKLIQHNQNLESLVEERSARLLQTEVAFRNTLDNMIEGVQIHDFDWKYIYVNKTLIKYSGTTKDKLIGYTLQEKYPGIEKLEIFKVLEKCMHERVAEHFESEFVFPDGRLAYFELSIQPVPEGIFILSFDITERKKTEEILQQKIKEVLDYKFALDESSIVAITDQKGIIKHVNQNFCKISKYSESELIGKDHRIINSGFHEKDYIKELWTTIANGKIWKGELKNKAKDGSYYWVDTTIVPFLNDRGKPYQYLAIRSDITERKLYEEKIYKVNRLYEFISSINKSIVHIQDKDELLNQTCKIAIEIGKFKYVWIALEDDQQILRIVSLGGDSQEAAKLLKVDGLNYTDARYSNLPEAMVMKTGTYAYNNDLQNDPYFADIKEELIKQNIHSTIAFPISVSKQSIGIIGFFSTTRDFFDTEEINLLEEAAGDISFALENYERLRKHKQTEELVEHNERRFRALIEKSTDMKTLTNKEGNFIYASPNVLHVFGYTEDEYLNKPAASFFHPEDMPKLIESRSAILDTPGKSFSFQYRTKHKNGNWVWCEGSITNMLEEPGVYAMVSNFKDITDRKEAEQQIDFNLNNLNALINNTNDLLWSIDKEYKLITYNKPFFDTIYNSYGVEISAGYNALSNEFNEEDRKRYKVFYDKALSGETFTETIYSNGIDETWNEISFYPLRNQDRVIGTACFSRNITVRVLADREREAMIADIIQQNKNFEQFAYIVSHNLRAPIANILGISEVLKYDLPLEERIKTQNFLFDAIRNLDEIVKDLNKILQTRTEITESKELVKFDELVSNITSSIQNLIDKEEVEIRCDFSEVDHVLVIKSYLQSIFYNLISNSIKYKQANNKPIIHIKSKKEGNKVILVFRDNGSGIDLKNHSHDVFGIYKRFHKNIEGKGLGLFMVKTQLEVLGGRVSIKSEVNSFTEFTIELPS